MATAWGAGALERGRPARIEMERAAVVVLQQVAVRLVDVVLDALDLTELVRVVP